MKPAFVQNRCFASTGWDLQVRQLCREHGLGYQGFSLLTANPEVLRHPRVQGIARRLDTGLAQVVFAFARQVGMIALDPSVALRTDAVSSSDPVVLVITRARSRPPKQYW